MMELFIIASLAVWRVSRMLDIEEGPFDIFQRIRVFVGVYEDEHGITSDNVIGQIFTCPLCMSVWIAIPFTLYFGWSWVYWLALSGASSALSTFTER